MKFNPGSIKPKVVYLSMGAYLESYMPTYSGGLEILAGDTLKTCADLEIPAIGFIQASHNGFYRQRFDENNRQTNQRWAQKYVEVAEAHRKKGFSHLISAVQE